MLKKFVCSSVVVMLVSPAFAEERWELLVGMRSQKLALAGWHLLSSSATATTGDRPVLVTYWRQGPSSGLVLRCFDYFDRNMSSTGGKCDQAIDR